MPRGLGRGMSIWPIPAGIQEKTAQVGDLTFRYLEAGPTEGGKGTILLLHGFGARSDIWLRVLKDLSKELRLIAPDLPCHGSSSQLPGKMRTVPLYREALEKFVDQVMPQRFSIMGSSLGGALAVMLTLSRPQKVNRLILLAASGLTPKLPGKTVRLYFPYVLGAYLFAPSASRFRSFLTKGVFYDPKYIDDRWFQALVPEWKDRTRRSSLLATANCLRRPDASVAASLPKIGCPTLALWGKQDAHFNRQENEGAVKTIPGSHFVSFDSCGHLPMVEKYSESLAQVKEFLA